MFHPAVRKEEYSETQRRWIPTQNSFAVYCGFYEFSVNDKQSQMMEEKDKYKDEDIAEAEGIVRVELTIVPYYFLDLHIDASPLKAA